MKIILNAFAACVLVQASLCVSIKPGHDEDTKSLTTTTVELLSSFQSCIVYVFDFACNSNYDSTKYIQLYSEYMNCAVLMETLQQYRTCALNERFDNLESHPLFTKYTKTLLNLYTPNTTSTILKMVTYNVGFREFILMYNIPFNYVLIFMEKEKFSFIDNVGLFSKLAMISAPAVYMLVLNEEEVNVIGIAHAFQLAPFLFRVTRYKESDILHLHQIIHKDMQGATARFWSGIHDWNKCSFGRPLSSHPHFCLLEAISENFNITLYHQSDLLTTNLSISEIFVQNIISSNQIDLFLRLRRFNLNFISYAALYDEFNFICIANWNAMGLMAFVQAYDLLTWIVAVAACVCLSATIALMAGQKPESFWAKLQSSAPVVVLLLLERFYGYGQVIRTASRQIGLVITLWAFGAMLLGMCYSGNIVSELTSPSLPQCPHDMQELAGIREYPVLTDHVFSTHGVWISFFHYQIEAYLEEYDEKNGSLVSDLRQFGKTLAFVDYKSTQWSPSSYNTGSKLLLAYVGGKEDVNAVGIWRTAHSRKMRVLRGGNLPFFNTWSPFSVESNFLGKIFQRFLGNLGECGIFRYWTDGYHAHYVNEIFEGLEQREKTGLWAEWGRESSIAGIWRNFLPLINGEAPWSATTLENLNAAFQLFATCMMLALCVFIKEKRLWQIVVHYVFRMAKNVLIVLNRITDNFALLLRIFAYWAVHTEPT